MGNWHETFGQALTRLIIIFQLPFCRRISKQKTNEAKRQNCPDHRGSKRNRPGYGHTLRERRRQIILWDVSANGNEVVEGLKKEGYEAVFKKISVTNETDVQKAVAEVREQFGRIDILINNAGITRDRTLLNMSKQEWDDVIAVNLTGVFNCTQAVAPMMKEQHYGRIVSASSNVAIRGNYGQTNYVATKSAIIGMTKVWAMELGRFGITVNCIAPGFIQTAMTDAMPEEVRQSSLAHIPVGHWGVPDDIANGYLYLASDEASFVSGICLTIDGGAAR